MLANRRVDAGDPEDAELPLPLLAVAIGVLPAPLDRLPGGLDQAPPGSVIALGLAENPLVALVCRATALDSRHGAALSLNDLG